MLNQWRLLCVVNDSAAGTRRVLLDGALVGTTAASTTTIPADTPLTLCAGCALRGPPSLRSDIGPPASFAEFTAWSGTLTDAQVAGLCTALRTKWDVPELLAVPLPSGVLGSTRPPVATATNNTTTPSGARPAPHPVCDLGLRWLAARGRPRATHLARRNTHT
jgi:hypothetical protein